MKKLLYTLSLFLIIGLLFLNYQSIKNIATAAKSLVKARSTTVVATKNIAGVAAQNTTQPALFTEPQTREIEKIARDFLMKNPEILIEMGKNLQKQEQEEQKAKIVANIAVHKNRLFDTNAPGRIVLGNPQGEVVLVEFTQHQCGHCKEVTAVVDRLLKSHPEIQLIVIYWPFFGEHAAYTAKAVFAAQAQNKAKELNQALFDYKDPVTKDKLDLVVQSVAGLDAKKLYTDINTKEKEFDSGLRENFALAKDLSLIGTPALVFANKDKTKFSLVPGQTPNFEEDLIKALEAVK
jgi:protein-disulfide isomerase